MNKYPLLSICIPTYQRAQYLSKTLQTITSQDPFLQENDVEIIISDNFSTDNTPQIVAGFMTKFPGKITYFRQSENKHSSENFATVLKLAHGIFRKLHNDTLLFKPGSLTQLLQTIRLYTESQPLLFFTNNPNQPSTLCHNLDEFIAKVSYACTWIGGFGLWQKDKPIFQDLITYKDSRLAQTIVLANQLANGRKAFVCTNSLFEGQTVKNKGKTDGYNIAQVFGYNYLNILKKQVNNAALSRSIYNQEKKLVLQTLINPFYFDVTHQCNFQKTGYFKWVWNDYKYCPYFYLSYLKFLHKQIKFQIKNLFHHA